MEAPCMDADKPISTNQALDDGDMTSMRSG
jgi:hypothetical protein